MKTPSARWGSLRIDYLPPEQRTYPDHPFVLREDGATAEIHATREECDLFFMTLSMLLFEHDHREEP